MSKKILSSLLLVAIGFTAFFSCRKTSVSTGDDTRNYYPIRAGKYVTYDVDSVYYNDTLCTKYDVKSQLMYAIADSFKGPSRRDSTTYLLNIFYRHYTGDVWVPQSVAYVRAGYSYLDVTQDNNIYTKLVFPITNGFSFPGNSAVQYQDSLFAYLKGWNYTYQNVGQPYNNGLINFNRTVSVLEDDESVNYPNVDSAVPAFRTYAREVYAYNVGLIYKEWTHWTYRPDTAHCVRGYTVTMRAVDYN